MSRLSEERNGVEIDHRPHKGKTHCFKGLALLEWCSANLLGWTTKNINDFAEYLVKKAIILDVTGEKTLFKPKHYFTFAVSIAPALLFSLTDYI